MKNRISIKIVALMMTLIMCFSTVPALALIYSPGPTQYELDRNYLIEANGVSLSGDKLVFEAGGSITFDVLLPFDTEWIYFIYETISDPIMFTITTDEHSYTTWFAGGSVNSNKIAVTENYGSNTITFTAEKAVTVTSVNFRKINENYNETNSGEIPLTDYEEAVLTSVVFKNDAPIVKIRGAIQNLDIDNRKLTPLNIDGRLYVPFTKLAESLGYYAEDYPDKLYVYMTGETQSLTLIEGDGYIESDKDGKHDFSLDVIYKGHKAWVPVRALSEALGFHVEYKDGFVVIDDRLTAKKVVETEDVFTELKDEFNPYILTDEIEGTTYHVSQTAAASDKNEGTENAPLLTIQEAANRAKAGDTVIVHEGTYRETVTFDKNDGTALNPITFKAAKGEKVVISALDKLSGFTTYKGKILKAQVPHDLGFGRNQLFYKGEALNQGRHPNGDTKPGVVPYPKGVPEGLYATRGNIRITEETGDGRREAKAYSDTDLKQEEVDYWKGGTYVTLKGQGWSLASGEIIASKEGELTLKDHEGTKSFNLGLTPSEEYGTHYYHYYAYPSDYAYITNHINTVDSEGEWFMDDNVMYVIPPENANLETDFEVKQRQLCIDLRGRKYITIEGIDTIGGGIAMSGDKTEGCILNDGEFKYIAHHTVLLDQNRYTLSVDDSTYSLTTLKAGEAGICIEGKNNAIVNSKIDYSSATGITLHGKYHYISNNTIGNTSYSGAYPGGIWITTDSSKGAAAATELTGGHFITYNTVYNSGRSTLLMGSTVNGVTIAMSPVEIAYNRFYNGALVTRDTGVTYEFGFMGGNDKSKTRMHHNYVYNAGYKDADTGGLVMLLYHDGYVAARDTYCNITYYEEQDKAPKDERQIFVQDAKYTVIRDRNNSTLGYLSGGEDDILRSDFPGGRRFEPGADHDSYARSMDNYNEFKAGRTSYYPTTKSADGKTYTFENMQISGDKRTELALYLNRTLGATGTFDVTAKAYNQAGTLVQTTKVRNTAETDRFYVYDLHKAESFLEPMTAGTYKIVLQFSDNTIDLRKIELESLDKKYDKLYTKEMEASGAVAYFPTSSVESWGTETVTFENVAMRSGEKTLLDLNMTRDYDKASLVTVTAEVYNASGSKVKTVSLPNGIKHSKNNGYEPLTAKIVIPELTESGNYKVVLKLSDTYSKAIRLVAQKADAVYDNLFNESVVVGGSFDERYRGNCSDVTRSASVTAETVKKYTYYPANDCWVNTLVFKNRTVSENASYLRVTQSSHEDYEGTTVKVYVDNYDKNNPDKYTPIVTWTTFDTDWKAQTKYFKLDSELAAGTHTFYFVYTKTEDSSVSSYNCSSLYNFSFTDGAWAGETLDGING